MRITDDRYSRDRLKFDLAFRLIRHEARTGTIRSWTGLSDDRIRKLFRSYVQQLGDTSIRRHRGKPPCQPAYFLRNALLRQQSSCLASILCQYGLLDSTDGSQPGTPERLRWGELFCVAWEAFLREHDRPHLGFEHACFLRGALERQRELALDNCTMCGALLVVPAFGRRPAGCSFCGDAPLEAAAT